MHHVAVLMLELCYIAIVSLGLVEVAAGQDRLSTADYSCWLVGQVPDLGSATSVNLICISTINCFIWLMQASIWVASVLLLLFEVIIENQ